MSGIIWCNGFQCPVKDKCRHTKVEYDGNSQLFPKYVGDTGCVYFMDLQMNIQDYVVKEVQNGK